MKVYKLVTQDMKSGMGKMDWEIGKKGYPLNIIKQQIEDVGFKIIKDYIVFESPYHHFFVLEK